MRSLFADSGKQKAKVRSSVLTGNKPKKPSPLTQSTPAASAPAAAPAAAVAPVKAAAANGAAPAAQPKETASVSEAGPNDESQVVIIRITIAMMSLQL